MFNIDSSFKGVISITKNRKVYFDYAAGYANLTYQVLNERQIRFATASAGKVFIATAILNLIEEGRLRLDSTIGEFFDWENSKIDMTIMVFELLTHTSGIPDYFDESVMDDYEELWRDYPNYKIRSSWDLVPLFIQKEMSFQKGDHFSYNNTGYVVLGLIIEKVSNMPFDEYLSSVIFKPCGMLHTGYYELDRLPVGCATHYGYDQDKHEYYSNIYSVDAKGSGAGGAFTTVEDIERFWFHLIDGKIIPLNRVKEMMTPQTAEKCYGYGLWLSEQENGDYTPYIQGCDPGVSFISTYDVKADETVTIISNYACNVWQLNRNLKFK